MSRMLLCEYGMASPVKAWTVSSSSRIDTLLSVPLCGCIYVVAPHICVIVSVWLFWAGFLVSRRFHLCHSFCMVVLGWFLGVSSFLYGCFGLVSWCLVVFICSY